MLHVLKRCLKRNYSSIEDDFQPHSVVKIISKATPMKKNEKSTNDKVQLKKDCEIKMREHENEMGIQMISNSLYQQIFGIDSLKSKEIDEATIQKYVEYKTSRWQIVNPCLFKDTGSIYRSMESNRWITQNL